MHRLIVVAAAALLWNLWIIFSWFETREKEWEKEMFEVFEKGKDKKN